MTQEEKVKAYDKALKLARAFYVPTEDKEVNSVLEQMFPELRESEDERIRKEMVEKITNLACGCFISQEQKQRFIHYLEKQKEQKPKQEPKWLYRLEFKDKSCGLWYNGKGEWCFESGIGSLDDSCKTKTLPMDYDERYKADGRDWFSSCSRKEDLLHWYSKEDARILLRKGFVFTRYLATEYTEYEQQTVFIKETALYREEIDFFSLFNEQKPAEWSEEDEDYMNAIIAIINRETALYPKGGATEDLNNDLIAWLKSLRPCWKPTKEQMNALKETIDFAPESFKPRCTLQSLLKQLKAL